MYRGSILHVSSWGRLALGLCLLVCLCLALGGQARSAHAQATLIVTNCSNDSQLQADVSTANSDNAGDTITFACSGDIPLTSTLTINGSMTLDGNGQSVTLDGQHQMQVLVINGGGLTLKGLTIANGLCDGCDGGVLFNVYGTVNITNSTFSGNSAGALGGAIYNYFGTVSITNSTFSGNSAASGGGAILNLGTLNITNSTFSGNSGPGLENAGDLTISGSIVAENQNGDCLNDRPTTDKGYNLDSDSSCFTAPTSQHANPQLAALANNGGPTQTMALQQGSAAIDQIPLASCPATDQRGVSRPDNGESKCDIGAYEFSDPVDKDLGLSGLPSTITVDATSPQGAVVTYTPPTATDESGDNPGPSVSCSPASGSTFAIGTTTVTCTATDSDDTNSPVSGSFQVVVKGAAAQVNDLITTVNSFHLPPDFQASFDTQLQAVQTDLTNNNTTQACHDLMAFINHAQSQSGKGLTVSQADQLIAAAKQLQAVLGC